MQQQFSRGGVYWTVTVSIPQGAKVEYKYLLLAYENGPNRTWPGQSSEPWDRPDFGNR